MYVYLFRLYMAACEVFKLLFFVDLSEFIKDYLNFPCIFEWNFQWSFRISNDLFTWWFEFIFFLFCCFSVSITLDDFLTEYNLLNYNFLNDLFNYGFLNKYKTLYRINTLSHNTSRQLFQIEKKNRIGLLRTSYYVASVGWMRWFILLYFGAGYQLNVFSMCFVIYYCFHECLSIHRYNLHRN